MKNWKVLSMGFAICGSLQAQTVIDAWDYEGLADGSPISSAVSTGVVGGAKFNNGKGEDDIYSGMIRWVHDDVVNPAGAYFSAANGAPSDPTVVGFDSGVYQYEVDYVSADFALTAASTNSLASGRVFFVVRDTALANSVRDVGCRLWYDSREGVEVVTDGVTNIVDYEEFRLEGIYEGTGGTPITNWTGSTSLSNLHVRMVMDLNVKEVYYYLTHDGGPEVLAHTGDIDPSWTVQQLRMHKQSRNGNSWWEEGDTMFTDNLVFSVLEAPTPPEVGDIEIVGAPYAGTLSNTTTNKLLASIAEVKAGDVIAVMMASNQGQEPDADVLQPSGSAELGAFAYKKRSHGASAHYYWTTVSATGNLDLDYVNTNNTAYTTYGVYHLTSGTGEISLIGSAEDGAGPVAYTSVTNSYNFGFNYSGIYLEAYSTYGANAVSDDPGVTVDAQASNKRIVAHGEFTDVSSFQTIWTQDTVNKQMAVIGLAFAGTGTPPLSPAEAYTAWLDTYGITTDTNLTDDADGDLLDNLGEYAFGGNPADAADRGNYPVSSTAEEGGTNYLYYVHYERQDKTEAGLDYSLLAGDDLVMTNWAASGIEFVGNGAAGVEGFDAVTNRIATDTLNKQFLDLQVGFTP